MQYRRILAVGDIHGMYKKLIALMDMVRFNPAEDLLVFLGDYIDRGPQSLECLDYVMDLCKQFPERVIPLLGNHEAMCLNYYDYELHKRSLMDNFGKQMVLVWLDNGGTDTHRQFQKLKRSELQKRLRWIRMLSNHYLIWIRYCFYDFYDGRYGTIVVGHMPTLYLKRKYWLDSVLRPVKPMFLKNNIILCDTGACIDGGKLSCVDVLSKKFWQA